MPIKTEPGPNRSKFLRSHINEGGGNPEPPVVHPDPMVQKLSEAVQSDFGMNKPLEGDAGVKKKSGADGTTPTGSTNSNDQTQSLSSADGDTAVSTGSSQLGGGAAEGGTGEAADKGSRESGGSSGDLDQGGTATEGEPETDPLKLLGSESPKTKPAASAKAEPSQNGDGEKNGKTPGGQLRSQLEQALSTNRDLEKRIKELEGDSNPRLKELTTAFESEKKRADAAEARIAELDYSQSSDFQKRFIEPYESSLKDTVASLRAMTKDDGSKLTQDELELIVTGGEEAAYEAIDKLFTGGKAALAVGRVQQLYGLERTRDRALTSARSQASEQRKNQMARTKAERESFMQQFESERDRRMQQTPEIFAPKDGDTGHRKALKEGEVLADFAMNPPGNLDVPNRVRLMAESRNRIVGFPVLQHQLKKALERADALEKELVRYRGKEPGRGEVEAAGGTKRPDRGTMEGAREALRTIAYGDE